MSGEDNQRFVYICRGTPNNISDDSDIEVIERFSSSSTGSGGSLSNDFLICRTSDVEDELPFISDPQNFRFEASTSSECLHRLHNELANSIQQRTVSNQRSLPSSRASSSEPDRLQIIQATNLDESLPESDSQLADIQYASNFELGQYGLDDVLEMNSSDSGSGSSSSNEDELDAPSQTVRQRGSHLQLTTMQQANSSREQTSGPSGRGGGHIAAFANNAIAVSDGAVTNAGQHNRNAQHHSARGITLVRDQLLTRIAVLILLFSFAFGLGHFLASRSLKRQILENVASFASVNSAVNMKLNECQQRQSDLTMKLEQIQSSLVHKEISDAWKSRYHSAMLEIDALKLSLSESSRQLDESQTSFTKCKKDLQQSMTVSNELLNKTQRQSQQQHVYSQSSDKIRIKSKLEKAKRELIYLENERKGLYAELETCENAKAKKCNSCNGIANSAFLDLSYLKKMLAEIKEQAEEFFSPRDNMYIDEKYRQRSRDGDEHCNKFHRDSSCWRPNMQKESFWDDHKRRTADILKKANSWIRQQNDFIVSHINKIQKTFSKFM